MNEINNFYGTNQFYIQMNNNIRIIYNLSNLTNIKLIANKIILTFCVNNTSSTIIEEFEDINEAEDFFIYIAIAISEGKRIIGRNMEKNLTSNESENEQI